ncbi:fumarylacetoacetate hydrolase family protein [Tropicibacter sp. Alg240-R139]|uniref:fumarylacetoacetate hydrolase family protein n=1 Tax=Tropicibacter sp. Alg240-R139 TaxID=2305991 RepID=UPI0019672F2B|nr:fumarylacetoacetate hydrolase family protein [Tropicibacter sp. Alg240-R139]
MKLVRFVSPGSVEPEFGGLIGTSVVAFSVLQEKSGMHFDFLVDSQTYLENLPESEQAARTLLDWGQQNLQEFASDVLFEQGAIRFLAPVDVAALFDFGLTPNHLRNSLETLLKYEKGNPTTEPILHAIGKSLISGTSDVSTQKPEPLPYYKCNMNSITGDQQVIPWPLYTSRLDIEPELAVIYGNSRQPVAGYCIFNDISARDVQAPEFTGGLCLTKDMACGNQLGPYLVTTDEVGDAYDQDVWVVVNGEPRFSGSTSEISHRPEAVFAWMQEICQIEPGTVFGFGTIPGCTGLDFDDFLNPGDQVEINFSRLGTLRCSFAEPQSGLAPGRWPVRASLERYLV